MKDISHRSKREEWPATVLLNKTLHPRVLDDSFPSSDKGGLSELGGKEKTVVDEQILGVRAPISAKSGSGLTVVPCAACM